MTSATQPVSEFVGSRLIKHPAPIRLANVVAQPRAGASERFTRSMQFAQAPKHASGSATSTMIYSISVVAERGLPRRSGRRALPIPKRKREPATDIEQPQSGTVWKRLDRTGCDRAAPEAARQPASRPAPSASSEQLVPVVVHHLSPALSRGDAASEATFLLSTHARTQLIG